MVIHILTIVVIKILQIISVLSIFSFIKNRFNLMKAPTARKVEDKQAARFPEMTSQLDSDAIVCSAGGK